MMSDNRVRCQAMTAKGKPCTRWATKGSTPPRCSAHPQTGKAPGGLKPLELTDELIERITDVVRAGNYMETAAAYAGVSKSLLHRWLKEGRDTPERYPQQKKLVEAVERAIAHAEVKDVTLVAKHAQVDWRAAAWRLERRTPGRWGRRETVEHTGPQGGPVQVAGDAPNLERLTPDQLRDYLDLVRTMRGDGGEQ